MANKENKFASINVEEVKATVTKTAEKAEKAVQAAKEKVMASEKAEKAVQAVQAAKDKVMASETAEKAVQAVKKTAEKAKTIRKDMKTTLTVQHQGKDVTEKEIVAMVKKEWTDQGNKIGDIRTLDLYVKLEEDKVYYVINGDVTGSVEI